MLHNPSPTTRIAGGKFVGLIIGYFATHCVGEGAETV